MRFFPWLPALVGLAGLANCADDGGANSTSTTTGGGLGGSGGDAEGGLVCDAPFVTKGPWSLRIDGTSAVVRWEACDAGAIGGVRVSKEGGSDARDVASTATPTTLTATHTAPLNPGAPADHAGTYHLHEAKLTGLEPGTCYRYELLAAPERAGRVCTARAPGAAFRFAAIGDTNPALGTTDDTIAALLPHAPDFTVHLGDIQYYDSLLETWASWFPVMQPLLAAGAFLPVIGNHEYEKPNEIEEYALRYFGDAGFGGGADHHRFESGGVWFFGINTEEPFGPTDPQGKWLIDELAKAQATPSHRFSVVSLHRPMLTCGDSGDLPDAFAAFHPIFTERGVLLVLAGHMHGYERFELGAGPTYLTTAGGGGVIVDPSENTARSYCDKRVAVSDRYHSVVFDVGATTVSGKVIDQDGAVGDTFERAIPAKP
ncbi:MAG: metallophosphoesterase [Deltaproteobacteria bacterium]|nr:metallophosphoesterase [Deltaproteobacteria bacterium]